MLHGKLFYRGEFIEAGIEVENGKIKKIGKLVKGKKIDGVILPAGIDVHVHFRDFEEKHKETIESGSLSALHGGICLVVDQPNTKPLLDDVKIYERRMEIARKKSYVDYASNIALTKNNAEKIERIVRKIEKKYYLPAIGEVFIQHSDENLQIDYTLLQEVGDRVSKKITVHAEDPDLISVGNPNFLYRNREAEIVAVEKCLEIDGFHFCHISTSDAAKRIARSNSTYEVTPHHLLFSKDDYQKLGDFVNVNPPLREKRDAEWLLKNFKEADVLASDHAPHTEEEKLSGASGFPGVETMYPIFVYLALRGVVSFKDLIEKIAINPAKIFGFRGYGAIQEGNFANFAVFRSKDIVEIKRENLHSKCDWSPFDGFKAVFPSKVFIRGEEALSGFEVQKSGSIFEIT
jgi:dihydroorotase